MRFLACLQWRHRGDIMGLLWGHFHPMETFLSL
nr:MAG TPA: hypothetical protein [Caudoviricetes sp.]